MKFTSFTKLNKSLAVLIVILSSSLFMSEAYALTQAYAVEYSTLAAGTRTPKKTNPRKKVAVPPQDNSGNSGAEQSTPGNLETCFSPNGGCDQKLISLIDSAQSTLDIAIYSITHAGITDAIKSAKARGVQVRMVVDRSQSKGKSSQVDSLLNNGISLRIGNFTGIMHDKFTIVDGRELETGSYNYSENATSNNAENQLYIDDQNVIQNYQANFENMFQNALAN